MNNKLSGLLMGAVITGLIAGSVAKANESTDNPSGQGDQKMSADKNNCKGKMQDKDKNKCKGKAMEDQKKKKDKNACSGKNGCEGKDKTDKN